MMMALVDSEYSVGRYMSLFRVSRDFLGISMCSHHERMAYSILVRLIRWLIT